MRAFLKAVAKRDGDAACGLLTDAARANLVVAIQRSSGRHQAASSCENAVSRISDVRPWAAMSKGQIDVQDAAGLDNRPVDVSYELDGDSQTVSGSVQPSPTGTYEASGAPLPITG